MMHARHATRGDTRVDGTLRGRDGDRRRDGRRSAIGPPDERTVERTASEPPESALYGDAQHETPKQVEQRSESVTPESVTPESGSDSRAARAAERDERRLYGEPQHEERRRPDAATLPEFVHPAVVRRGTRRKIA